MIILPDFTHIVCITMNYHSLRIFFFSPKNKQCRHSHRDSYSTLLLSMLIVISMVLMPNILCAQDNTVQISTLKATILSLFHKAQYQDVIRTCTLTLGMTANNTEALWYRALCYRLTGADSLALQDLNALQQLQQTPEVLAERATVLHRLKRHTEALSDIDAAIAQAPTSGKYYALRGSIYHAAHLVESACRDFTTAQILGHALANDLMISYCRGVLSLASDTVRQNDEKTQHSSGSQAMTFLLDDTDNLYTSFYEWSVSAGYERREFLVSRLYYDTRAGAGYFAGIGKMFNRRIAAGIKAAMIQFPFTFGGERGKHDSIFGNVRLWELEIYTRYAAPASRVVDITGIVGAGYSIMNFPVSAHLLNSFSLPVVPNNGVPDTQGVTLHFGLGFEAKPLKRLNIVGFIDVAIAMMNYHYMVFREARTLSEVSTWNIGAGIMYNFD